MKLTIQETTEQPTLHRKAITARIFFTDETPSRQDVAEVLATKAGVDRETLVVARIKTNFGESSALVQARSYDDKQFMRDLERDNLLEKNKKVEPEPEPAEEAGEESSDEEEEPEPEEEQAE